MAIRINEHYGRGGFGLSFEFFPPKNEEGENRLDEAVEDLIQFNPSFITCTYGAGGSTRDKTLEIVKKIRDSRNLPVAAHLTCVGSTVDQLRSFLSEAQNLEIDYIVALRGDPPKGETEFKAVEGGLRYANELVALIRAEFPHFSMAVAGYPEVHVEAPSPQVDLENLKRKVDAGGDVVITQLFYNNADFLRFRDDCIKAGIEVPIVPGVLPTTGAAHLKRMVSNCGAKLPSDLYDRMEALGEDVEGQRKVGVEHCTQQLEELIAEGVPGVHFYVINRAQPTGDILRSISIPHVDQSDW
ncbi:MAG: methylenetetrahydrofolate reductase [NAD(P)H] [Candidatus Omnitrophica bacterium]|nr:methylenetetrahydrofolate reductase [NAD(P)H] [Candidatus Omnitrophota bacterium]MCA9446623.1 methylenetetrahydrofolate reductase [NAD(P)H] [Candidatus Omnitrophota bacterium]